jgi:hypothetical protein
MLAQSIVVESSSHPPTEIEVRIIKHFFYAAAKRSIGQPKTHFVSRGALRRISKHPPVTLARRDRIPATEGLERAQKPQCSPPGIQPLSAGHHVNIEGPPESLPGVSDLPLKRR